MMIMKRRRSTRLKTLSEDDGDGFSENFRELCQ
jgi:hypothetical protein